MHTQTLITSGYCNLFRGDKTRAKHQFDQASNHASELGLNHELLRCKKGQARLAFVNGDLEHAEALLEEILEESKENQYIYINFLGWRMYVKLMAAKNQTFISSKNRSNFLQMLKVLEENTVSDPLRAYFEETKRRWSELGFIL
jgi:hypothetical protein